MTFTSIGVEYAGMQSQCRKETAPNFSKRGVWSATPARFNVIFKAKKAKEAEPPVGW
jgi:hypothetical protein